MKLPNLSAGIRRVSGVIASRLSQRVLAEQSCRPGWSECNPDTPDDPSPLGGWKYFLTSDCHLTNKTACELPEQIECGPCQLECDPIPRFIQRCTRNGTPFTRSCTLCLPEVRVDLPWPISDRCIRICCSTPDPSSCSVSVRTC